MIRQSALLALSLSIFSFNSIASAQGASPDKLKTNNNDLRGERSVFSVVSHKGEGDSFTLLETGENQFLVDASDSGRLKVSSEFASKADGEFVKSFIDLKYGSFSRSANGGAMQDSADKTSCENVFTLSLRGEEEVVCRYEKARIQKVHTLVKGFKKQLKIK